MNIDPPCKYRYKKGIVKHERFANQKFWQSTTLKNIFQNPVYLGHVSQGRRKSRLYEGKKEESVAPENWVVVKNTHEPIIAQEIFDNVQLVMQERRDQYNQNVGKYDKLGKTENIFKGKVVCGDCDTKLTRYKNVKKDKLWYTFICPTHVNTLDKCSFLQINESVLKNITLSLLKKQISHAIELEKVMENVKKRPEVRERIMGLEKDIRDVNKDIQYIKQRRKQLFSDFADKVLSQDEYQFGKEEYSIELHAENERLLYLKKQQTLLHGFFTENKWIKELKNHKSIKALSKDMIDTFINKIIIYTDSSITIEWNFRDPYEIMESMAKEVGISG